MAPIQGGVAVIVIEHPPVNSIGLDQRLHIAGQLEAAQRNAKVQAIVIAGAGQVFCAGADIAEFGTPRQVQEPTLRTLLACIEASPKPVVAAISGLALGGGLELALACHGRVAHASARVGLPEVTLGLIPGCGGTQRLPRLIGADAAVDLMLGGQAKCAHQLADSALFDRVTSGDVLQAACDHARALAAADKPFPRVGSRALDAQALRTALEMRRSKLTARQQLQPAFGALLDAVGAAALPLEDGLRKERELFVRLIDTPAARALRYQFRIERQAAKPLADMPAAARAVLRVAVIGAGTMGAGIAIAALDAGLAVLLLEQDEAALAQGRQRVLGHYRSRLAAGKIRASVAAQNEARLTATTDWARLREADLVIEAVYEDLAVKRQVFGRIDLHARAGAVLATNTSYLDVDAIASATSRPGDVLGLHFFSPAHVIKLLEVVRGSRTAPEVLATGMAFGSTLKKTPVLAANAFGFIGNRIYNAYRRQCEFMLEDGAWPEDVDAALEAFGFAMGPFAVADMSGLDIAWRMRKAQAAQRDPRERYVPILDWLCEAGRLGRKAAAGYYSYIDGRPVRSSDAIVRGLIEHASELRGVQRRSLPAQEILRRALLGMVNEALLLLEEGVASRAGDVDVFMVLGYGFPRWEGGPLYWAARQDRGQLARELDRLAQATGHGFTRGNLELLSQLA